MPPPLRALRVLVAALCIAGTTMGAAFQPQATQPPLEDGITFWADRTPNFAIVPGQPFNLIVVRNVDVGPLHFAEVVDGNPVDLGPAAAWQSTGTWNGLPAFKTTFEISDPTEGQHTYQAIFDDDGTHAAITRSTVVDVAKVPTTVTIQASANPVQTNHAVTLSPSILTDGTGVALTGDLVWRDTDTNAVIETDDVTVETWLTFTPTSAGTRHIRAEYSGDGTHAAASSDTFTLMVTNDAVQASGVTIDVATFYPVKDGYRDVVRAKGNRQEPASVRVSIYNSSNRVVRTLSAGRAGGGYSLPWNGRSNGGTLQPAGRYKIVQVLTDDAGNKMTVSKFVNLSPKKLVYATKYVTKNGSSLSAKGKNGTGSVYVSTSAGYVRLRGSYPGGWAGVGYQFTLPAATVYKSIAFQAYVKGPITTAPNLIGMQNFAWCSISTTWSEDCFDHWAMAGSGPNSPVWVTSSGSANNNRTGRTVRGMASANHGTAYIYKVRVKVVVGTLK